jgi:glycerophosphoryl diester phosphodiesterase
MKFAFRLGGIAALIALSVVAGLDGSRINAQYAAGKKIVIAHRGASAYAPEHTAAAYRLAVLENAEYVEQDLQITRDGRLVCLHDTTLDRTTNVAKIFPRRFFETEVLGEKAKSHPVFMFTLAEIKRLDAGSWFGVKFRGERVPTFQEAIDIVRGKAGLYPETKEPEFYERKGFDMERLLLETLRKNGLDTPGADPKTPVVIQSFSAESLKKLRAMGCALPLVFLIDYENPGDWLSPDGMRRIREFASGVGPSKKILDAEPKVVRWAHDAGLTVTPYTFKSSAVGRFADVTEEMRHYLFTLNVEAVFTDNPDKFPRESQK